MLKCYLGHVSTFEEEYDTIAVSHRSPEGVFIFHEEFGEQKVEDYGNYLARPFTQELSLRKLRQSNSEANKNTKLLYQVFLAAEKLKRNFDEGQPLVEGNLEGFDFTKKLLRKLMILPDDETKDQENGLVHLNFLDQRGDEGLFREGLFLDNKIIVRSRVNADLIS